MNRRITASVKMRLVVEVTPHDTWGEDCTIDQIEKQGREAAINMLQGVLALAQNHGSSHRIRIIDVPDQIQVVLNVDKR